MLGLTPEAWRQSLARNLDTAFLVTRAVLPDLVARALGTGRDGGVGDRAR